MLTVRTLLLSTLLLVCVVSLSAQDDDVYGFTATQVNAVLTKNGLTSQRLHSLQTFGSDGPANPAYLAVLSSSHSGWHISVFHRMKGGFKLEWASHNLPVEFSVSAPGNFSVSDIGDESTVIFSGCAPHRCGGDYHGFVLYSPVRKEAFFALLSQEEDQPRKVTFSNNALEPRNSIYKEALQKQVDEVIHRTDIK